MVCAVSISQTTRLLSHQVLVRKARADGATDILMEIAVGCEDIRTIETLVRDNINVRIHHIMSALSTSRDASFIARIVQYCEDANAYDVALMLATHMDMYPLAHELLARRSRFDVAERTAIHVAAHIKSLKVYSALLAHAQKYLHPTDHEAFCRDIALPSAIAEVGACRVACSVDSVPYVREPSKLTST
jgi:hypothetical protein